MTQHLKTQDGEYVSAELAMNMVAVAVRNLRHANDTRLLQYLLDSIKDNEDSVFHRIFEIPQVQKVMADYLGIPELAVPNV